MLERFSKVLLLPITYLIAVDNFLLERTQKMDMYVVCKKNKEFIPFEALEVIEVLDKRNGTAVKFMCPFCNKEHTSMIMEKPH